MKIENVYLTIKYDEAFEWSVDKKDYANMSLVLSAWGFKHSLEHAFAMIAYAEDRT
jgi:hypothetical protein